MSEQIAARVAALMNLPNIKPDCAEAAHEAWCSYRTFIDALLCKATVGVSKAKPEKKPEVKPEAKP